MLRTILMMTALSLAACGSSSSTPIAPGPPQTPDAAPRDVVAPADAAPVALPPPVDAAPPPPDPAAIMAALLADETAAYEAAKPVLVATCARCHQQGGKKASRGKLKHFDMTSYPFTGHHTREVGPKLREVLGAAGKPASMPPDGDLTPEQLAPMLRLAEAWDAAEAGGAHAATAAE